MMDKSNITKTYTQLESCDKQILSSLLHSIPTGVFVVDQRHKVLLINQAGASYVNRKPDDCCECSCTELFHTESCDTDRCCIQRVFSTGQCSSGTSCYTDNQQNQSVTFYCSPLYDHSHTTVGCIVHLLQGKKVENLQPTISSAYEQLLEQLNNQWTSNQELMRQNKELHQLSQTIGNMASEKTAIELIMLMVDRLRNSATCIGGLMKRHLRSLPATLATSKTALVIQDEIRRLEKRMQEIESLLDSRQRIFQTIALKEIINDALFSCSRFFHEQKTALILKKSKDEITIKACREILVKSLGLIFRQLATMSSGNQASIEITHDHTKAYITCTCDIDSPSRLNRTKPAAVSDNLCQDHSLADLRLAYRIIAEHGGDVKEHIENKEKKYTISLPKEWRML